ncbi:lysoplasmalogenase family protein [Parablastomonas sp. CN1-191]|uniref:lysoplasmalogenase family protein n=1 Tax=Parablastomonas sp. CN1-191 TaxID=3400908 RepID=UPI003BF797D9
MIGWNSRSRALPLLVASLLAGIAYVFIKDGHQLGALRVAIKMAAVGCLALYLLPQSRRFAGVLALAALGDGLIEANIYAGAAAFVAAHVVAISFYVRNRRAAPSASRRLLALTLLVMTPLIAVLVLPKPTDWMGAGIYAPIVGAMAAAAWLSRFPRYRTGIGAVLFVGSDLLLFAQTGALASSSLPALLIWPLYYAGQLLIALGVASTLASPRSGA